MKSNSLAATRRTPRLATCLASTLAAVLLITQAGPARAAAAEVWARTHYGTAADVAALRAQARAQQHAQQVQQVQQGQQASEISKPVLNEIAPVSTITEPAWVEIAVQSLLTHTLMLPVLQRGEPPTSVAAVPQGNTATQATQATLGGISLAGFSLSDEDGNTYRLPASLPELPFNGFVVVVFGPGTDDAALKNGVVTLYAPAMASALEADGDQISLYNTSNTLIDFVAWGKDPGANANAAVAAGKWVANDFLFYNEGFGADGAANPATPHASFGRWNGRWESYAASNSTRGRANALPAPLNTTIADGSVLDASTFGIDWQSVIDADRYRFELATSADFATPLVQLETAETSWVPDLSLPDGDYFWRVRALDRQGHVSGQFGPMKITKAQLLNAPATSNTGMGVLSADATVTKTLLNDNNYRIQRKDTTMLDIGGGPKNFVTSTTKLLGEPRFGSQFAWDTPHVYANGKASYSTNDGKGNRAIDSMYCVRASVSMLNSYYGGSLSLDRVSYHRFEEIRSPDIAAVELPLHDRPENDMGFNKGMSPDYALDWALGINLTDIEILEYCPTTLTKCPYGKFSDYPPITFAAITSLIDAGRPFISINLGGAHARVIDGYADVNGVRSVHVLDPVPKGCNANDLVPCTGARWESYTTFRDNNQSVRSVKAGVTIKPIKDEASLWQDTDHDGVNNFDEIKRFKTDPYNEDTDGDGLKDKEDIASYVFDSADNYAKRSAISFPFAVQNGKQVFDFRRMELKPDNDMDLALDGCEDANRNGKLDPGETSNFLQTGGVGCRPELEITAPTNNMARDVGPINKPSPLYVRVRLHLPDAYPVQQYAQSQFKVFIDKLGSPGATKQAPIYAFVQPFDDEVNLYVNLPTQPIEGKYTVRVEHTAPSGVYNVSAVDGIQYSKFLVKPNVGLAFDTSLANPLHPLTVPVPPGQIDAIKLFAAQLPAPGTLNLIATAPTATVLLPKTSLGDPRVISTGFAALASTTPTGTNFLGSALLLAQSQLSQTAPGPDESRHIIAINGAQPDATTLNVRGDDRSTLLPAPPPNFGETQVHVISIGNSQADFQQRLAQGFGDTSDYRHAPLSTTLDGVPLRNEWVLADQLLGAADNVLHQVRFDEAFGNLSVGAAVTRNIPVDGSSVVFNAMFDRAGVWAMTVIRPDGSVVTTTDANTTFFIDERAMRVRVDQPTPGTWKLVLQNTSGAGAPVAFATFTSGETSVVPLLLPAVQKVREAANRSGRWPCDYRGTPQCPYTITLALANAAGPINGANVELKLIAPNGTTDSTRLVQNGDGIYASEPFVASIPGAYQVRVVVQGTSNGQPFTRYVQGSFVQSKPVAYVFNELSDLDQYESYRALLSHAGIDLTPVSAYALTTTQLSNYRGFVIAADSAAVDDGIAGTDWATAELRDTLNRTGLPILGLGEGGYALFNDLGLNLGSASTVTRTANMISVQAVNPGAAMWSQPFMLMGNSPYTAFTTSPGLRLNIGTAPAGFEIIGIEPGAPAGIPNLVNIGRENTRYALWGFGNGPANMTENGKRAFINLAALMFG